MTIETYKIATDLIGKIKNLKEVLTVFKDAEKEKKSTSSKSIKQFGLGYRYNAENNKIAPLPKDTFNKILEVVKWDLEEAEKEFEDLK